MDIIVSKFFANKLDAALFTDKNVLIHCRRGIGRAALMAACLFVLFGDDPETAFRRVSAARGVAVPETVEQMKWVIEFAARLPAVMVN